MWKSEGSLPLQMPANCPYSEPDQSNIQYWKINIYEDARFCAQNTLPYARE